MEVFLDIKIRLLLRKLFNEKIIWVIIYLSLLLGYV